MNPLLISEVWRDYLATNSDLILMGVQLTSGQSAETVALPRCVVSARLKPLNGSGTVCSADMAFAIETHAGDGTEPETDHIAVVDTVRAYLQLGDDAWAGRAAVAAQLSLSGVIDVAPRYVAMPEIAMERDGDRFRTVLRLRAGTNCPLTV